MAWRRAMYGLPLTEREIQILATIATHGSDGKTIARLLNLHHLTVKSHKDRIARKLGIANSCAQTTAACIAVAFRTGILTRNILPPFAAPTDLYAAQRAANPYLIRHPDGTVETVNTWARHVKATDE